MYFKENDLRQLRKRPDSSVLFGRILILCHRYLRNIAFFYCCLGPDNQREREAGGGCNCSWLFISVSVISVQDMTFLRRGGNGEWLNIKRKNCEQRENQSIFPNALNTEKIPFHVM